MLKWIHPTREITGRVQIFSQDIHTDFYSTEKESRTWQDSEFVICNKNSVLLTLKALKIQGDGGFFLA